MDLATSSITEPTIARIAAATDHRVLARRFALCIAFFFAVGLALALLLRAELLSPDGWLFASDTFGKIFSLHGILMVYFVALPAFSIVLGLGLLPGRIGAPHFAFPRLNRAAWYLFAAGGLLVLGNGVLGGADTGWSFSAPYSMVATHRQVTGLALGVLLAGLAYLLIAVNVLTTFQALRDLTRPWHELPLVAVGIFAGALSTLIAAPALCLAMFLVIVERALPLHLYDGLLGGNPAVFNQIFWFFATPALYGAALPAAGAVSDIIEHASGRPLPFRRHLAYALLLMACFSLFLWGRHLMSNSEAQVRTVVSALLNHLAALPFGLLLVSWIIALTRSRITPSPALAYARMFVFLLVVGGLTGLGLASPALQPYLHNTVFVIAHFHLVVAGALLSALLAALHAWGSPHTAAAQAQPAWPARAAVWLAGVLLTFGPLLVLGSLGLPRRHHLYPSEFQVLQVLATAGATVMVAGLLMAVRSVIRSRRRPTVEQDGPRADSVPAAGL